MLTRHWMRLPSGTTWRPTRTRTYQNISSRVSSLSVIPPCCLQTTCPHQMQPIDCPTQKYLRAIMARRVCLLQGSGRQWLEAGRLGMQHPCLETVWAAPPLLRLTKNLAPGGMSLQSQVWWGETHKGLTQVAQLTQVAPQHNQLVEDCHKFHPCHVAGVEEVSFPWTEEGGKSMVDHSLGDTVGIVGTATRRCLTNDTKT